jgi:hypothetical protein
MGAVYDAQLAPFLNRILHGDCREVLQMLPDASIEMRQRLSQRLKPLL